MPLGLSRVCGEPVKATGAQLVKEGLSPRVRGNQRTRGRGITDAGSIPACAGEP